MERLFVYGTLAPGKPNEHVLAELAGTWSPATVYGTLIPQGWGAALGFPGIVLDGSGDSVPGFVFTSDQLTEHWQRLDAFEGEGYERVSTTARLADGQRVDSQIYVLRAAEEC